ncbi:MAG: AMP-binding protein, partial [Hyphomicrobiales bacterium]
MSQSFETTLDGLLQTALNNRPDHTFLKAQHETFTLEDLAILVAQLAGAFYDQDVRKGVRVATQIADKNTYVATILALARLGAVWVPLDERAKPAFLSRRLSQAKTQLAVADEEGSRKLRSAGYSGPIVSPRAQDGVAEIERPPDPLTPDDWRAIMFTSGTTGKPKGVIVTERMICAAGQFATKAAKAGPDETFMVWEPLNHIGGAQMIPAALISGATLATVDRFSAKKFWQQAKELGATRLHYLGGILDLLEKQPAGAQDLDHHITHGFGAAARAHMWEDFQTRFGVQLTEVYGQTEASSFCLMNEDGVPASIGRTIAPFEAVLKDTDGTVIEGEDTPGELYLHSATPGLISPGYLDAPDATNAVFKGEWFRSGDLARRGADGNFYFAGRTGDAIRRRGENIS